MEPDLNPEVNYVVIIRKGPLLLFGALFFACLAYLCWDEWNKLTETEEES